MSTTEERNFWLGVATLFVAIGVGVLFAAEALVASEVDNRLGWVLIGVGAVACVVAWLVNISDTASAVVTLAAVTSLAYGVGILGAAEWLMERNLDDGWGWSLIGVGAVVGLVALARGEDRQPAPRH